MKSKLNKLLLLLLAAALIFSLASATALAEEEYDYTFVNPSFSAQGMISDSSGNYTMMISGYPNGDWEGELPPENLRDGIDTEENGWELIFYYYSAFMYADPGLSTKITSEPQTGDVCYFRLSWEQRYKDQYLVDFSKIELADCTGVVNGYKVEAVSKNDVVKDGVVRGLQVVFKLTKLAATEYPVWVGSTKVTSDNMADILGESGKAKYDPDTKTLTFYDVTVNSSYPDWNKGIYSNGRDLTIKGKVTVSGQQVGIEVDGGTLTIAGDVTATDVSYYGLSANAIVIESGTVNVKGINAYGEDADEKPIGSITISGGNVTSSGSDYAIYSGGTVTISGGTVKANGDEQGILAPFGTVTVSGDSTEVTAKGNDYAIYAKTGITVNAPLSVVTPEDGKVAEIKEGESFSYYTIKNDDGVFATEVVIKNATPAATHTVTFKGNGGTPAEQTATTDGEGKLTDAQVLAIDNNVSRDGYILVGWSTSASGTPLVSQQGPFTEDTTLYAVWGYPVWVGDRYVTEANRNDVLGDGKVSYDPESKTLTFDDANIPAPASAADDHPSASRVGSFGIDLTITGKATIVGSSNGIWVMKGDEKGGSLTLKDAEIIVTGNQYGIKADSVITVTGEDTAVTAEGDNCGVNAGGGITVEDPLKIITPVGGKVAYIDDGGDPYYVVEDPGHYGAKEVVIKKTDYTLIGVNVAYNGFELNSIGYFPQGNHPTWTMAEGDSPDDYLVSGVNVLYTDEAQTNKLTTEPVDGEVYYFHHSFNRRSSYPETVDFSKLELSGCSATIPGYKAEPIKVSTRMVLYHNPDHYVEEVTIDFKATKVPFYTVTFDSNGGGGAMDSQTVNEGDKLTLPANGFTAPSGKQFDKWDLGQPGDEVEITADTIVTAQWKDKPSGGGSGSGGGSSTPAKEEVNVADTENGEVSVDPEEAKKGQEVTVTPEPDEGYEVDEVKVTDEDGKEVPVTDNGDGTYSFKMPDGPVDVEVTFKDKDGFSDVGPEDWFYEEVLYAVDNGLMNGVGHDLFAPYAPTSRAMIVTILYRMEGEPEAAAAPFSDVPAGQWYSDAVAWASEKGIVLGFPDGTFRPDDLITREQFAAILYRYAQYKGYDVSAKADLSAFADAEQVSDWALPAVQWEVGAGLFKGDDKGNLRPQDWTSRAEAATLFQRFAEMVK